MSKRKNLDSLFAGRHFDRDVIILCVRWYLRYKLSLRDLVEMMAERGLSLAHTTILRWVRRYTPEFVKRWNRFATPAGRSWRVNETYLKVRGTWVYIDNVSISTRCILRAPPICFKSLYRASKKIIDEAIERVAMFYLCPMPALSEYVQLRRPD
ncbi:hypothetical protein QFZ96_000833 [Paraburkholderia youngii]